MKNELLKISIRKKAIYLPEVLISELKTEMNQTTSVLVANAAKLGFGFSEDLLSKINQLNPSEKIKILETLKEVKGVNKNWTPLVKGWDVPTGETIVDHVFTLFANIFKTRKGTTLPCGHIIPKGTFPLERYNGCPFCGTPFKCGEIEYQGQGSNLTVLEFWTDSDLEKYFNDLLLSKTALDATQVDSLKTLLKYFPIPEGITFGMKETLMLVIDAFIENEKEEDAQKLFNTPNDILRYLWYKHTGFLQIIEPKTLIERKAKNDSHIFKPADQTVRGRLKAKQDLKLKYTRKECRRVALWLNNLDLDNKYCCEIMHPKRGMWVRLIRALRLAEYSKRKGFEKLADLLDIFYKEKYAVWQGKVNYFKLKNNSYKTFAMLKQRPGLFARSLFSNMLWFGAEETMSHFHDIMDQVPARLIFTLNMYAPLYFDKDMNRSVKPLGGKSKRIPPNKLLSLYDENQLKHFQTTVEDLCLNVMKNRFAKEYNINKSIYIDEALFNIPVSIGDRSETIQDLPSALMGTKFPLEGSKIRLFMQWGNGLPAQHLDMDLSCMVAYERETAYCSYSQLVIPGCKHSGDIQSIPEMIGTAEYIEIDVDELDRLDAKYVSFTCNAYTRGALSPNMVVGWMDSKYKMKISEKTGVAYDPSCVQHQVRIEQNVSKGLVFGVLDVAKREIIWLEQSFGGQVVQNLDTKNVESLLKKLDSKLNIGNLLCIKADAQELERVADPENADEVYDMKWAQNSATVTQLLLD